MTISKQEARNRATRNWAQWRLLIANMVTYRDLYFMDDDDIAEANAALDIHIENERKEMNRNRK
ncbi:hypothetical protein [Paenibacillus sp. RC84]|uniref:hypothetical protein n=1 Tax=Paenibacillus sp. RC84 TaxID=3156252 RepID=UPI003513D03C